MRTADEVREAPFDALATDYDAAFSRGLLGGLYRRAVWARVDAALAPGCRVLDVGCGTGEDALHLAGLGARVLAVDASGPMTDVARAKTADDTGRIEVRRLRAEDVGSLAADPASPFDVVLSNFGVLNCVEDPRVVAEGLARCTRSGARAFLCVMGPLVPWEWAWFLLRGDPARAFRRLRPGGTTWRGARIRYPSAGALRRAFAPAFRATGATAVGALLPPSYAEPWARRHPALTRRLDRWERRFEAAPPLACLADHVLLELVRR